MVQSRSTFNDRELQQDRVYHGVSGLLYQSAGAARPQVPQTTSGNETSNGRFPPSSDHTSITHRSIGFIMWQKPTYSLFCRASGDPGRSSGSQDHAHPSPAGLLSTLHNGFDNTQGSIPISQAIVKSSSTHCGGTSTSGHAIRLQSRDVGPEVSPRNTTICIIVVRTRERDPLSAPDVEEHFVPEVTSNDTDAKTGSSHANLSDSDTS
ncbi:hypothetical protein PM082_005112 [Marasmius tenuissimus]|nr:hypothetical protein PM082_005112 [Marasmius tenuissimus]